MRPWAFDWLTGLHSVSNTLPKLLPTLETLPPSCIQSTPLQGHNKIICATFSWERPDLEPGAFLFIDPAWPLPAPQSYYFTISRRIRLCLSLLVVSLRSAVLSPDLSVKATRPLLRLYFYPSIWLSCSLGDVRPVRSITSPHPCVSRNVWIDPPPHSLCSPGFTDKTIHQLLLVSEMHRPCFSNQRCSALRLSPRFTSLFFFLHHLHFFFPFHLSVCLKPKPSLCFRNELLIQLCSTSAAMHSNAPLHYYPRSTHTVQTWLQ